MDAAYELHRKLLAKEYHGPGDMEAAMYRLQAKYGLDFWAQWLCRYRRRASDSFGRQVRLAYLDTLERSVRRDLETLRIEQAKGALDDDLADLVAESETLLAKIKAKRVA